jgi:putative transposase
MLSNERPDRKAMLHTPPFWIDDTALFFVTLNCQQRGQNQLAHEDTSTKLIDSWLYYHDHQSCAPLIIMVMPDHLHLLISFSWKTGEGMPALIKSWKRYTAKQCDIQWQRDYFDHRIRNQDDFDQKWDYILNNPVKAGLTDHPSQWPHQWISPTAGQSEYLK